MLTLSSLHTIIHTSCLIIGHVFSIPSQGAAENLLAAFSNTTMNYFLLLNKKMRSQISKLNNRISNK